MSLTNQPAPRKSRRKPDPELREYWDTAIWDIQHPNATDSPTFMRERRVEIHARPELAAPLPDGNSPPDWLGQAVSRALRPEYREFIVREVKAAANPFMTPGDLTRLVGRNREAAFAGKPDEVFGLIATAAGGDAHPIDWGKGDGLPAKGEFVAALPGLVERHRDVYKLPHHPPVPGLYYLNPIDPAKGGTSHLDSLVGRFLPATDAELVLIKALFVTVI